MLGFDAGSVGERWWALTRFLGTVSERSRIEDARRIFSA
jgi:hypothetical protein